MDLTPMRIEIEKNERILRDLKSISEPLLEMGQEVDPDTAKRYVERNVSLRKDIGRREKRIGKIIKVDL